MKFRLVIRREQPEKDIQIFAPSMEVLKQVLAATLANFPDGTMATLYRMREEKVGVVQAKREDGRVYLVPMQEQEKEEEKGNEAVD